MDKYEQNRRSIRLQEYDYASPGAYFVTICTYNRACILWNNDEDQIHLSKFGQIASMSWLQMREHSQNIRLDEFCIMPNHMHGIIQLTANGTTNRHGLSELVRWFKSNSARRINNARHTTGIPVWQRNYFEHIIRDEKEWAQIRAYISVNPDNWKDDRNFISLPGE